MAAFPALREALAVFEAAAFVLLHDFLVHVFPKAFTVAGRDFAAILPMVRRLVFFRPIEDFFMILKF